MPGRAPGPQLGIHVFGYKTKLTRTSTQKYVHVEVRTRLGSLPVPMLFELCSFVCICPTELLFSCSVQIRSDTENHDCIPGIFGSQIKNYPYLVRTRLGSLPVPIHFELCSFVVCMYRNRTAVFPAANMNTKLASVFRSDLNTL